MPTNGEDPDGGRHDPHRVPPAVSPEWEIEPYTVEPWLPDAEEEASGAEDDRLADDSAPTRYEREQPNPDQYS